MSEEELALLHDPQSDVPRRPMFWGKNTGSIWAKDVSTRAGMSTVTASNLLPRVYYYECPDTPKVKGETNSCGAVNPYGGVAETIDGKYCFKMMCDDGALTEDVPNQLSGCGMVNDGQWQ
jgi:hypothetical protein